MIIKNLSNNPVTFLDFYGKLISIPAGEEVTTEITKERFASIVTLYGSDVVQCTPCNSVEEMILSDYYQYINPESTDLGESVSIDELLKRVEILEAKIKELAQTNPVEVTELNPSESQPDADLIINLESPITEVTSVTAKSVDFKSGSINSSKLSLKATGNVDITNLSTEGDLPKSTSNCALAINTDEYVTITDSTWNQTGYNAIEIGLSNTAPKNVNIENIDFSNDLSNNAISIFAMKDGGIINITKCHFKKVSNMLRLSNRLNSKITINITDVTVDEWDTRPDSAGLICLQDYTSKSNEEVLESNRFSPEKITINLTNVTGPYGKVVITDPKINFGSNIADKQIAYIYSNELDGYMLPYSEDRYPKFNVK